MHTLASLRERLADPDALELSRAQVQLALARHVGRFAGPLVGRPAPTPSGGAVPCYPVANRRFADEALSDSSVRPPAPRLTGHDLSRYVARFVTLVTVSDA